MDREKSESPIRALSKTSLRRDSLAEFRPQRPEAHVPEDGHPDEIEDILFALDEQND